MTLRIPAKVLIHVWSYDFYDVMLSTEKQRCHMIIGDIRGIPESKADLLQLKKIKNSLFNHFSYSKFVIIKNQEQYRIDSVQHLKLNGRYL